MGVQVHIYPPIFWDDNTGHTTMRPVDLFPQRPGNIRCNATNMFKIQARDRMACTARSLASAYALHSLLLPGILGYAR